MTPTEQLRDPALEHLRFAARLADEASTSKLRTRLAAAASEASGFAGWLALDLGDHGAARRHYDEAIKRAHQAQRPLLAAYMVGSMSLWAAELGNGNEAVALSEQAYGLLPLSGQAPPAAEVWMALVEATARRVVKMPRRRTTRSAGPSRSPNAHATPTSRCGLGCIRSTRPRSPATGEPATPSSRPLTAPFLRCIRRSRSDRRPASNTAC